MQLPGVVLVRVARPRHGEQWRRHDNVGREGQEVVRLRQQSPPTLQTVCVHPLTSNAAVKEEQGVCPQHDAARRANEREMMMTL